MQLPLTLLFEFLRYAVVGGIAFLADFGTLVGFQELVFRQYSWGVYVSTACGFVVGLAVNNSIYTHYFHPVMAFLPILWSEIVADLAQDQDDAGAGWRASSVTLALTIAVSVIAAALVAAAGGSVAFAGLPAVHLSTFFKATQWSYMAPVALTFVVGMLFVLTVFGVGNGVFRRRILATFVPAAVLISFALTPQWRDSVCEMFAPTKHVQRDIGREVAKLLPEGAVVIGERSTQVLMGQPFRTATTMPGCNPIPIIEKLLKRDPQVKLYGLLDSQNAYNIQHLQKNKDRYDLRLLKKFSMPSFASAKPADVFFCQIAVKETHK